MARESILTQTACAITHIHFNQWCWNLNNGGFPEILALSFWQHQQPAPVKDLHTDTTHEFAAIALEKIAYLKKNPLGFLSPR